MCGIFCLLLPASSDETPHTHDLEDCLCNLRRRGPDCFNSISTDLNNGQRITLSASVLQTQGKKLCPQPICHDEITLCWNGDVFSGPLVNEIKESGLSDTEVVSKHLSACLQQGNSPIDVFIQIAGPYSFILFCKQQNSLWFGRDPAGRHSLLFDFSKDLGGLILSSVAHSNFPHMKEVPAIGLFEVTLTSNEGLSINLYPWSEHSAIDYNEQFLDFSLPVSIKPPIFHQYIFRPSVFSKLEPEEDYLEAVLNISKLMSSTEKMQSLINLEIFQKNVTKVLHELESAVKVRVKNNLSFCQTCVSKDAVDLREKQNACPHSKVAILFSGGLDSAILARLVDKFVPQTDPIDLLNVAFERKKERNDNFKKKAKGRSGNDNLKLEESPLEEDQIYNVPDRLSGRKTLQELQMLCPSRKWNFVEINVPYAELNQERTLCISNLIHPLKTVLDDSLGCALWFAARGQGKILGLDGSYTSPVRIVISGMGADEQFGGYMRHRTILRNGGWEALHSTLQMELQRIPSRNLGRDDRVVSHHGRQPRMPFLDENVINFVKSLPPWERCCPIDQYPSGIGDKLLLRLVAWQIGLKGAALLPKRALQFGSRIANSKENAADTSVRL